MPRPVPWHGAGRVPPLRVVAFRVISTRPRPRTARGTGLAPGGGTGGAPVPSLHRHRLGSRFESPPLTKGYVIRVQAVLHPVRPLPGAGRGPARLVPWGAAGRRDEHHPGPAGPDR